MKRLIAVVVAVVMIVGAVLLRDRIDGDDGSGGSGGGDDGLQLVCDTSLADVCEQLAAGRDDLRVEVRESGATSDGLSTEEGQLDADAWLTTSAWPEVTADNRAFAGLDRPVLDDASEVLARSPAMIVTRSDGRAALEEACGAPITWRCVGGQVPPQRVGLPTPERADGLTVLASAADSWFEGENYDSLDLDGPDFAGWFDDLTGLSATTRLGDQTPLARALAAAGTFTTVGALEAETSRRLAGSRSYEAIYAEPMVTADVVLVPRAGSDAGELLDELGRDALTEQLRTAGWRVDGRAPEGAQEPPSLPDDDGLPSAGVLQALRARW